MLHNCEIKVTYMYVIFYIEDTLCNGWCLKLLCYFFSITLADMVILLSVKSSCHIMPKSIVRHLVRFLYTCTCVATGDVHVNHCVFSDCTRGKKVSEKTSFQVGMDV